MLTRILSLALLVAACSSQARAQGKQIFVVPESGDIRVMSEDLLSLATLPNPGAEMVDVFATPDGSRYLLVSKSTTNTVTIVRAPIGSLPPQTLSFGSGASAALLTRDGGLLVVASQILRVIDVANAAEVLISGMPGTVSIQDIALSPDHRYVYALSPTTGTILQVDLITRSVIRSASVGTGATHVSASLNNRVYVSGPNSIIELDGRTLQQTASWVFSGLWPGKITFSPDQKFGLTPNRSGAVTAAMLLDLNLRQMTGVYPIMGTFGDILSISRIEVLDNGRAIALAPSLGKGYELRWPDATYLDLGGTGGSILHGFALSEETPSVRYAWLATGAEIRRINAGNVSVANTTAGSGKASIFRAGRGTLATPADIQTVNSGMTVAAGGQVVIAARAVDSNGAPVMGTILNFSSTTPGLAINTSLQVLTGGDGYATAVVTAPTAPGTYSIGVASNTGLIRSVVLYVGSTGGGGTGGGGGSTVTTQIKKVAGDGQILAVSIQPSAPVTVQLTDSTGAPLINKSVVWSSSFDVVFLSSSTTLTDASGKASADFFLSGQVQAGANFRQYQITAQTEVGSVAFSAIGVDSLAGPPIIQLTQPQDVERRIVLKAGEKLVGGVQAYIVTNTSTGGSTGIPIPNVGMYLTTGNDPARSPTVSCEGGAALSNETGLASCTVVAGPIIGSTQATVSIGGVRNYLIQVTVDPGAPAGLNILGGSDQDVLFNQDFPRFLSVKVVDKGGNGLRDIPLTWTLSQTTGIVLVSSESRTDSNGEARARVRAGSQAGTYQVRVQAGDYSVTFNLRVTVPLGALAKVSGDNQATVVVGREFPDPLVVQVQNAAGAPVAGVVVQWEVVSGSALVSATSTMTDVEGRARVRITAGPVPGAITIRASVPTLPPVTFALNSRPAGPEGLAVRTLQTFYSGLTSGGWAILTGRSLVSNLTGTQYANLLAPKLPTTLAGVTIEFGGTGLTAPIYSVSNVSGQEAVVFLVPWELGEGVASLTVKVGDGSASLGNIPVRRYYPLFLEALDPAGRSVPFIVRSDGTLVSSSNPARRGEQVMVYAINLGQTSPLARTNVLGGVNQKLESASAIGIGSIALYGSDVSVVLSPHFMGIYEVTFKIPENADVGSFVPFGMQIVPPGTSTPQFTQDSFIAIDR